MRILKRWRVQARFCITGETLENEFATVYTFRSNAESACERLNGMSGPYITFYVHDRRTDT